MDMVHGKYYISIALHFPHFHLESNHYVCIRAIIGGLQIVGLVLINHDLSKSVS